MALFSWMPCYYLVLMLYWFFFGFHFLLCQFFPFFQQNSVRFAANKLCIFFRYYGKMCSVLAAAAARKMFFRRSNEHKMALHSNQNIQTYMSVCLAGCSFENNNSAFILTHSHSKRWKIGSATKKCFHEENTYWYTVFELVKRTKLPMPTTAMTKTGHLTITNILTCACDGKFFIYMRNRWNSLCSFGVQSKHFLGIVVAGSLYARRHPCVSVWLLLLPMLLALLSLSLCYCWLHSRKLLRYVQCRWLSVCLLSLLFRAILCTTTVAVAAAAAVAAMYSSRCYFKPFFLSIFQFYSRCFSIFARASIYCSLLFTLAYYPGLSFILFGYCRVCLIVSVFGDLRHCARQG